MTHKKLSPSELAKAKAKAAARAPLLILLTRKFGFQRINPREAMVAGKLTVIAGIYRRQVDERVYQVHIMGSGVNHAAYVTRPGDSEPGEAVLFKNKDGLLAALAALGLRELPTVKHEFQPAPATAADLTQGLQHNPDDHGGTPHDDTPAVSAQSLVGSTEIVETFQGKPADEIKRPPADAWK